MRLGTLLSGASWVVAYGERPVNATAGALLQRALTSLGADLYVCAPPITAVAAMAADGDGGFYDRARGKRGVAVLGLGRGDYARVRVANRSSLLVEQVRARDGLVRERFGVIAPASLRRV